MFSGFEIRQIKVDTFCRKTAWWRWWVYGKREREKNVETARNTWTIYATANGGTLTCCCFVYQPSSSLMIAGNRVCARAHSFATILWLDAISSNPQQESNKNHTLTHSHLTAHCVWCVHTFRVDAFVPCALANIFLLLFTLSIGTFFRFDSFVCLFVNAAFFSLALYKNHWRNTLRLFDCWRLLFIGFAITKMRSNKIKQQKHTSAAAAATTILR